MTEYITTRPRSSSRPLYRGVQFIWYIVGIIDGLLLFRFILKLLGANPAAGFTNFIYSITAPFAEPFLNVFQVSRVAGATVEWTTVLAMIVYWLIGWAIVRLLAMGRPVSDHEARDGLRNQDAV